MKILIWPKVNKKYVYRHRILEFLYNKLKDEPVHEMNLQNSISSYQEIADALRIPLKEMAEYHEGFHTFGKDDDHVKCKTKGGSCYMILDLAGLPAYLDDYWLREGQKELNERI